MVRELLAPLLALNNAAQPASGRAGAAGARDLLRRDLFWCALLGAHWLVATWVIVNICHKLLKTGWRLKPRLRDMLPHIRKARLRRLQRT
jgi:hypothetical protein